MFICSNVGNRRFSSALQGGLPGRVVEQSGAQTMTRKITKPHSLNGTPVKTQLSRKEDCEPSSDTSPPTAVAAPSCVLGAPAANLGAGQMVPA
jgi:hypothetical protein